MTELELCRLTDGTARRRRTATPAAGGSPASRAGQTENSTTTAVRCTGRIAEKWFVGSLRIGLLFKRRISRSLGKCSKHHFQVFDVPVPFCLNKLYRTDCPIDCRAEEDDQVCGSDGNIYRNQCELEKITCGYAKTTSCDLI